MPLRKCKDCQGEVSSKARACPKCGAPVQRSGARLLALTVCLAVVCIWFLVQLGQPPTTIGKTAEPIRPSAVPKVLEATRAPPSPSSGQEGSPLLPSGPPLPIKLEVLPPEPHSRRIVVQRLEGTSAKESARKPGCDRHGDPLPAGATQRLGTVRFRVPGDAKTSWPTSLNALVFLTDGKRIVTGGMDGRLRTWDIESGKQVSEVLVPGVGIADSISLAPDGQFLAFATWDNGRSAGLDKAVRVWKVGSDSLPRILEGHEGMVTCVAYTPDGKFLFSGGEDAVVRVWDAATMKFVRKLDGHGGGVTAMIASPDGRILAVGADNEKGRDRKEASSSIWLHSVPDGRVVGRLVSHKETITCLSFSPDGKSLVSGSRDETARIWDTDTKSLRCMLPKLDTSWVTSVVFGRGGKRLAVGQSGGRLSFYSLEPLQMIRMYESAHYTGAACLAVSPDGSTVASTAWDGVIRLWDMETGEAILPFGGPEDVDVFNCTWVGATGTHFAKSSSGGGLQVWDTQSGEPIRSISLQKGLLGEGFMPDGKTLVTLHKNFLCVWNADDEGNLLREIDISASPPDPDEWWDDTALSANGKVLCAVAGWSLKDKDPPCIVRIWTLTETDAHLKIRAEIDGSPFGVEMSADGSRVAVSSDARPSVSRSGTPRGAWKFERFRTSRAITSVCRGTAH